MDPPDDFGCPRSNTTDTEGFAEEQRKEQIYVRIEFDRSPWEQGFLLTSLSDGKIHAYHPIGSFKTDPYGIFEEGIELDSDAAYKFVYLDEGGNGFKPSWNATHSPGYRIYLGSNETGQLLVSNRKYMSIFAEHIFVVGYVSPEQTQETTSSPTVDVETVDTKPTTAPLTAPIPGLDEVDDDALNSSSGEYLVVQECGLYTFILLSSFLMWRGLR